MEYCYSKLWKKLIDKNINRTVLREESGISTRSLARLGKGQQVSLDTLYKICVYLKCDIGDIIERGKNNEE
jgi:DNA-binding Xre family transcriptional regulator